MNRKTLISLKDFFIIVLINMIIKKFQNLIIILGNNFII
uniref:Uncharacterized protein n=1 Tax=Strongyloides stercoralis TaxID=6248 RepID=A0A0K0E5L1_STRER